jgi:hypothetical protein
MIIINNESVKFNDMFNNTNNSDTINNNKYKSSHNR